MKKYFYLQIKRASKIFPLALVVAVTLYIGFVTILFGLLAMFDGREDNTRFTVAIAGDTDNKYISWGLAALQMFDEARFSIEFVEMDEAQARRELEKGDISAYVVLPEEFMEKAVYGDIEPVTYVTSSGMEGIASILKREITAFVTDIVVYSQKGTYGVNDALFGNDLGETAYRHVYKISLEYADFIFQRNELYSVNELGVADGLSTTEYYVCVIYVMLFVLMGMPFAVLYIKRDYAFNRLLVSRGYSCGKQLGCEYGVHFITMLLLVVAIMIVSFIVERCAPEVLGGILIQGWRGLIVKFVPIIIMISAFNIFMFELSSNLVSGILLHFFVAIGLCYVSGCMYPIYAFPKIIVDFAAFLPTGIVRSYLATFFTFDTSVFSFIGLIIYAGVFYAFALLLRIRKIVGIRR
ncbi:MAG: ABC transporter permease [Lachnospiraceae bacterium]|nr:ABC transporter permease [Lachnospiraceae bacterium]